MPDRISDSKFAQPQGVNGDSALINRISGPPKSYLEQGVDCVTAPFISNDKLRENVDHYAGQFIKTATLFTGGKVGIAGALLAYGLDQASPNTAAMQQVEDFALGATKGVAMKGLFHVVGTNYTFAPTKGALIGIGSRGLEDLLQRDTFTNPSNGLRRLSNDVLNPQSIMFDAAMWTVGEGAFGAANAATKGALVRSPMISGVAMGSTFGLVNGGAGEILRQKTAGEKFDLTKVLEHSLLEGAVSGAAAGVGMKLTQMQMPKPVTESGTVSREGSSEKPVRQQGQRAQAQVAEKDTSLEATLKPEESTDGTKPARPTSSWKLDMLTPKGPTALVVNETTEPVASAGGKAEARAPAGPKSSFDIIAEQGKAKGLVRVESVEVPAAPPQTTPAPKEYVLSSGKENLDAFRANKSESAMVRVREIIGGDATKPELGPEKSLFVQQLTKTDGKLLPEADKADLIATAYPETLPSADRAKHVFSTADARGKVFLLTDNNNRLLFANGVKPQDIQTWRDSGFTSAVRLNGAETTFNVMAPLLVGDPANPHSEASKAQWAEFDRQLAEAKKLGVDSVSTDVWWGMIEPEKGKFDFSYPQQLAEHITKAGLKWNPILSLHQCGGNVGDTVNIALPKWIWGELASKLPSGDPEALKFKSEQGHTSPEYISFWADDLALEHYASVMKNFQSHFANMAPHIGEVNISLGPAGELRYPSYNSHDVNTGYPTRGALQAYSELAIESFRDYVGRKYGGVDGVGKAWGIQGLDQEHILPPSDAQGFFDRGDHFNTQYGKDFFDWYNQSVIDHGRRVMTLASSIFAPPNAAFTGIDLGAKVPGIAWRVGENQNGKIILGDREAELAAGLIRTSSGDWNSDVMGRGYRPILSMFRQIQPTLGSSDTHIVPAFTAMEMPDGDNGPGPKALPHSLATWFGQEAERQGLWTKGENALNGNLYNANSWDLMRSLVDLPTQDDPYHGMTFLRMGDVVDSPVARAKLSEMVHAVHSIPEAATASQPSWWDYFFRTKK